MTLESFIKENAWDECRIFLCDVALKNGLKAPKISGEILKRMNLGRDQLLIKKISY